MNKLILKTVFFLTVFALSPGALSANLIGDFSTYKGMKKSHEAFLRTNPSKEARLEAIREITRKSGYGTRINKVFNNFEGSHAIDPTIKGVGLEAKRDP